MVSSSMATASGNAGAATGSRGDRALEAAAQGTAKHTTRPQVRVNGVKAAAANPYLGLVPDPSKIDWAYWKSHLATKAEKRYAELAPPTPFVHDEQEPAGTHGSNDSAATAEEIPGFGTAKDKHKAVRILGDLFVPDVDVEDVETAEDQGSIPLATDTGIPAESGRRHDHQRDRRRPARQRGGRHRRLRLLQGLGRGRRDDHRQHRRQRAGHGGRGLGRRRRAGRLQRRRRLPGRRDQPGCPSQVPADGDYYAMIGGFAVRPAAGRPVRLRQRLGLPARRATYTAMITVRPTPTPTTTPCS